MDFQRAGVEAITVEDLKALAIATEPAEGRSLEELEQAMAAWLEPGGLNLPAAGRRRRHAESGRGLRAVIGELELAYGEVDRKMGTGKQTNKQFKDAVPA